MTRTLYLLILLYLVWRIAGWFGRQRRREFLQHQERMGVVELVRCDRCGRYLRPEEVRQKGRWTLRRQVCADGCDGSSASGRSEDGG